MIKIKRVYDAAELGDGARFLVDRLWPRGVSKEKLNMRAWLKEAAPSNELRRWYGHDPERWEQFRERYFYELDQHETAWAALVEAARREDITLLYSSTNEMYNNAVALKQYLERHLARP